MFSRGVEEIDGESLGQGQQDTLVNVDRELHTMLSVLQGKDLFFCWLDAASYETAASSVDSVNKV